MNKIQTKRLIYISILIVALTIASLLILFSLKQNINIFLTPTQLLTSNANNNYYCRLGGLVKKASIKRGYTNLSVRFVITDFKRDIIVNYDGILPDLFREEKGVVVEGYMNKNGEFEAKTVLAKHDENYMPKAVYESLRKQTA